MKASELRELSVVELNDKLADLKAELFNLRFQLAVNQLENTARLKSVKKDTYFDFNADKCKGCKACMKIGCPAVSFKDGKAVIDTTLCTGCGLCEKMCAFGAIEEKKR